jgi:hypothetical protein
MEFRCVALIALWTLLSGPVFSTPPAAPPAPPERPAAVVRAKTPAPSKVNLPPRRP